MYTKLQLKLKIMYLNQSYLGEMELDFAQQRKIQNNRVKVAIRVRPFVEREIVNQDQSIVFIKDNNKQIILGEDKLFQFDRVFSQNSTQPQVYNQCVKDLVLGCFEGYNAAILAYGQTGSGKTYTMGTSSTDIDQNIKGIVPRVITQIFSQIQRRKQKADFVIKSSFLQIYNEHIIDLLSDDQSSKLIKNRQNAITIRDQKDGSVSIYGITQEKVLSADHMLQLLDRGSFHRTTASTMMNDASSRSHAIFSIFIQQYPISKGQNNSLQEGFITAKFVFVDLAGSERVKKTGATGATLKEGININLGLLELGNVISALSVEKKEPQFITFRNSKLTRILQDSLGGNSNTYMIACISPSDSNYEQSLNTMKYAGKAMNIKTKPVINRDPHTTQILQLKARISQLQNQNGKLKNLLNQKGIKVDLQVQDYKDTTNQELKRLQFRNTILQKKCQQILIDSKQDKKKKNQLQITIYQIQRERDLLKLTFDSLQKKHPQIQIQIDKQQVQTTQLPLIQTYMIKNQDLQAQLLQKQKIISQLQIQYTKLHDINQRDQKILLKKNETIYTLSKTSKDLKRSLQKLEKQSRKKEEKKPMYSHLDFIYDNQKPFFRKDQNESYQKQSQDQNNGEEDVDMDDVDEDLEDIYEISEPEQLSKDNQYLQQASNYSFQQQRLGTQLKKVQKSLAERQNYLTSITNEQMELQFKLIEEMKQDYHRKIYELEIQKSNLISQRNNEIFKGTFAINQKTLNTKIDALQNQLKFLKKKGKQQRELQKKVTNQNNEIKTLSNQLKQFRLQKIELNRKLKQDKDNFNKYRAKRTKQILLSKKQNLKKDGQIRKLKTQNQKQTQQVIKKKDQIKKIKKVNETLKNLLKPRKLSNSLQNKMNKTRKQKQHSRLTQNLKSKKDDYDPLKQIPQSQHIYDKIISDSFKPILLKLDHQLQLDRCLNKCTQLQKQIQILKTQESQTSLQIERLKLKLEQYDKYATSQEQIQKQRESKLCQQLQFSLVDIRQRLSNVQQNLDYFCEKYEEQYIQDRYDYNAEVSIIYNVKYNYIECQRCLLIGAYNNIYKILRQNLRIKQVNQEILLEKDCLNKEVEDLKQEISNLNSQYQRQLSKLREEMMIQYYHCLEQLQRIPVQNQPIKVQVSKLPTIQEQRMEKRFQDDIKFKDKKIDQLSKINRNLSRQVQVWRNKCNVIQEKYSHIKNLTNKDKYIGINKKDPSDIIIANLFKQQKQKQKNKKIVTNNDRNDEHYFQNQREGERIKQREQKRSKQKLNSFQNQSLDKGQEQQLQQVYQYHRENRENSEHMENRDNRDNRENRENRQNAFRKNVSSQDNRNQHVRNVRINSNVNLKINVDQVLEQADKILKRLDKKVQIHNNTRRPIFSDPSPQKPKKKKIPMPTMSTQYNEQQIKEKQKFTRENRPKVQIELFDKNQWQNIMKIDAHTTPILSMATTQNLLISGATRVVKIWDLQTNKFVSDITGFASFVRSVNIDPNRQLLAASSDQNITLWDLREGQSCATLTASSQQIQVTHIVGNYLFAGAKTIYNSNGLLVWDLRKLDRELFVTPCEQKQRNLSVFSMNSHNDILYYGTRDHLVRRLNITTMQTLPTFQPPHMDTVTALCILNDSLISGSKDKNLKLWDLQNPIYNGKYTIHACIDYVTSIQADKTFPIFYAADRSGQVKIGKISQHKIKLQFLGGITAHSQSVNAVCSLSQNTGIFATGSSDKTIKLWKPSMQKLSYLQNDL